MKDTSYYQAYTIYRIIDKQSRCRRTTHPPAPKSGDGLGTSISGIIVVVAIVATLCIVWFLRPYCASGECCQGDFCENWFGTRSASNWRRSQGQRLGSPTSSQSQTYHRLGSSSGAEAGQNQRNIPDSPRVYSSREEEVRACREIATRKRQEQAREMGAVRVERRARDYNSESIKDMKKGTVAKRKKVRKARRVKTLSALDSINKAQEEAERLRKKQQERIGAGGDDIKSEPEAVELSERTIAATLNPSGDGPKSSEKVKTAPAQVGQQVVVTETFITGSKYDEVTLTKGTKGRIMDVRRTGFLGIRFEDHPVEVWLSSVDYNKIQTVNEKNDELATKLMGTLLYCKAVSATLAAQQRSVLESTKQHNPTSPIESQEMDVELQTALESSLQDVHYD